MIALVFATARECAAALPDVPVPDEGGWGVHAISGRDVAVLVTGVGPLNAALGLGRLLEALPPVEGVVNLGVAGSFDTGTLPVGSVAAAGTEVWPEYGLRTEAGVDAAGLLFPVAQGPDGPIRDRIFLAPGNAAKAMQLTLPAHWAVAPFCTVSAVSADEATAAAIAARIPPPENGLTARAALPVPALENMEGFALALGCLRAELPYLEVRAVSNPVGSRDKADWDLPGAFAALERVARVLFATEEDA